MEGEMNRPEPEDIFRIGDPVARENTPTVHCRICRKAVTISADLVVRAGSAMHASCTKRLDELRGASQQLAA